MKTWQSTLFGIFLGFLFSAVLLLIISPPRGKPIELSPLPTPAPIVIYLTGAVNNPGVYALPRQSRLNDAIDAAGGMQSDANQTAVNLAAKLVDGQRIVIPTINPLIKETQAIDQDNSQINPNPEIELPSIENPLNLNTATLEDLDALPGIGPTRAADFIAYRTLHGSFATIEEIMNISGIGQATFDRIKAIIYVDPVR